MKIPQKKGKKENAIFRQQVTLAIRHCCISVTATFFFQ
jgi:hypothetical protein